MELIHKSLIVLIVLIVLALFFRLALYAPKIDFPFSNGTEVIKLKPLLEDIKVQLDNADSTEGGTEGGVGE